MSVNKKIIKTILIISAIQFFIGAFVIVMAGIKAFGELNVGFFIAVIIVVFSSILSTLVLYFSIKNKNDHLQESIKNLEEFNTKLRAQRHDYLNHIQVIYGLMELEEYEEAKKYMEPVFKDIMKVSKALKTKQPAVNALLQAKMEAAEKENIDFYMEIKSDLKYIAAEPWELCKVLANLIDNAITALFDINGEKKIEIDIWEKKESYIFEISNNGPDISEEKRELIFKQGFTTKKEEGHGMGLFIVSQIVKENKGKITVSSNQSKTSFCVEMPKMTF